MSRRTGRKIACLFPAFAMRYRDSARQCLDGFQDEVARLLAEASAVVEINARKCEEPDQFVLEDELENNLQEQYACYINSCAVGSLVKKRNIICDYVAGYSMGLFAALYHSSAVSFQDGLQLTHHTCTFAHEAVASGWYGMAVITGITAAELSALIAENCSDIEVTDVCGPKVVIVSGTRSDLAGLLEAAERAGCLHCRFLPVSVPFHSSLLRQTEERIKGLLAQIQIRRPAYGIVSCVNQKVLDSEEDVREEIAGNVSRAINWLDTMNRLLTLGVDLFLECGLSESLCKLARSIDGDYEIYHPRRFDRLFASIQ